MPPAARHQAADRSGVSHAENGTGRLPCLRRLKRSSSAAATTRPSTTRAADGSWNRALIPSTRNGHLAHVRPTPAAEYGRTCPLFDRAVVTIFTSPHAL